MSLLSLSLSLGLLLSETLAPKTNQLRQAHIPGGTSTQPVKQAYGIYCLTKHVSNYFLLLLFIIIVMQVLQNCMHLASELFGTAMLLIIPLR